MVRSLAPALAAGTTTVIKMPGQTAQTNALVSRILSEAPSLPRGVINLFSESGADGSKILIASPDVPVISFTEPTATGRAISAVGAQRLKRFGLELGGKTPHLVFDDTDLDAALPVIEKSLTVFAGQFCMTGSRLLVQRGIADAVRTRLAQRLAAVRVGPAADPLSDMGPLIDKPNVARVDRAVEEAIAAGAKVVVRGGPVTDGELARGAFYRPTLLEVDSARLDIVQKETFGPVMTMQVFDTEAEAVALANDSEYGQPRQSGHATCSARCGLRGRCRPARSGSTTGRRSTTSSRRVGIGNPAWVASTVLPRSTTSLNTSTSRWPPEMHCESQDRTGRAPVHCTQQQHVGRVRRSRA